MSADPRAEAAAGDGDDQAAEGDEVAVFELGADQLAGSLPRRGVAAGRPRGELRLDLCAWHFLRDADQTGERGGKRGRRQDHGGAPAARKKAARQSQENEPERRGDPEVVVSWSGRAGRSAAGDELDAGLMRQRLARARDLRPGQEEAEDRDQGGEARQGEGGGHGAGYNAPAALSAPCGAIHRAAREP